MRKKLLSLLLACFMMSGACLVSCGKDEEAGSSSSSSSKQPSSSSSSSSEQGSSSSSEESSSSSSEESSSTSSEESSSSSSEESSSSSSSSSNPETPSPLVPWESSASAETQEKVEALLASKHKLTYNEDGSFRVAIFADMHINVSGDADKLARAKENVKKIVDEQKPNLVILTGDNIISSGTIAKARQNIDAIVSYLEEKQIPWCHVYGNHDHEGSLPKSQQQEIYESYAYCISKTTADVWGVGNYVHGIYNKDGSLGAVIYCLDSGAYVSSSYPGYYDFIKEDQIAWYEQTSKLIQEYNNGELVYGMMAFHIPLIENRTANANKDDKDLVSEYSGAVNENMCPSEVDTELLETIWERGDIKAIVTGHDHTNDYMFNYKGVKLTASPTISEMGYATAAYMGSRIFDLNESTITNIPTRVAYIIERYDPNDYNNLDKNIVLEDFEGEVSEPAISGYASNALSGTASVTVVEEKGFDDSKAIEIKRGSTENFEFVIDFAEMGKVGENKYLIVWMDLTYVEFRKACVGLASSEGPEVPYRVDDNDSTNPKFYYLAEGSTTWTQLSHGSDGCFGTGDSGASSVKGKRGYFAFPISTLKQGTKIMDSTSLVTGFYFYGSLEKNAYVNVPFYIDDIHLVEDYNTFNQ